MSHSLTKVLIHAVWSTKYRHHLIDYEVESRVYGIISDEFAAAKCNLIIVNGMPDHVHCLFELDSAYSLSAVIRQVKGGSSHVINQSDLIYDKFSWQVGYSAFSVSESMFWRVFNYIKNQKRHHQYNSFSDELSGLLTVHGIDCKLHNAHVE